MHLLLLTSTDLIHLNKQKEQLPVFIHINDLQMKKKATSLKIVLQS